MLAVVVKVVEEANLPCLYLILCLSVHQHPPEHRGRMCVPWLDSRNVNHLLQ